MHIFAAGWPPQRKAQRSAASASTGLAQTSIGGALLRLLKEFVYVKAGFRGELVRQRWELSAAIVHLNPLDAVHGKENDVWSGRLSGLHQLREIVKRLQVHAAQAGAGGRECDQYAPEFLTRILQRYQDQLSGIHCVFGPWALGSWVLGRTSGSSGLHGKWYLRLSRGGPWR